MAKKRNSGAAAGSTSTASVEAGVGSATPDEGPRERAVGLAPDAAEGAPSDDVLDGEELLEEADELQDSDAGEELEAASSRPPSASKPRAAPLHPTPPPPPVRSSGSRSVPPPPVGSRAPTPPPPRTRSVTPAPPRPASRPAPPRPAAPERAASTDAAVSLSELSAVQLEPAAEPAAPGELAAEAAASGPRPSALATDAYASRPPSAGPERAVGPLGMPEQFAPLAGNDDALPTRFVTGAQYSSAYTAAEQRERLKSFAANLSELCEAQLRRQPDKHRAARLYFELGRLHEEALDEPQVAAKHYASATKLSPELVPAVRGLRRVQQRLQRLPLAVASLDSEAKLVSDPLHQAMLLYSKAGLHARLDQRNEAREALAVAARLAPHSLPVLKATAQAHEQALDWAGLASVFAQTANALVDYPAARAAYLAHQARVTALRLKDLGAAIELYKLAVAIDPTTPAALSSLRMLLTQAGRWREVVETLQTEAQLVDGAEERAQVMLSAASIYLERLGDQDSALKALEYAASLAPTDLTILLQLARVYEAAGAHGELANALERHLALESTPSAQQYYRVGRVYEERLARPELAIDRYVRALSIDTQHAGSLLALERLYVARGDFAPLAQMLMQQATRCIDSEARAELLFRVASICEKRLLAPEQAVEHYRKALAAAPSHVASYKALVRIFSQAANWHDLVELFERQLEQELSAAERIATLFKLGRVEEDALGLPAAAVNTYQRILEVDPNHAEAIEAVQRAAERGGRFEALVLALELEAQLVKGTPREWSLRLRAAEVVDEGLSETSRAIDMLDALLADASAYRPAIVRLCGLLHREGQFERLALAYQRELAIEKQPTERAALYLKVGELFEFEMTNPAEAAPHYRKAVQADPKNAEASRSLRRALAELRQFKELAQVLEQEASLTATPADVANLWYRAGEIYENHLEAPEKALSSYQRALEAVPGFPLAKEARARMLEFKKDHKALQAQLKSDLELPLESFRERETAFRLGELARDHLKQLSVAAEAFERVLKADHGNPSGLLALERLYVQLDDPTRLAEAFERQAGEIGHAGLRVAAYRAWLRILELAEADNGDAIKQAYTAVLNLDPSDTFALFALEDIALRERDSALLEQVDAKLAVAPLDRHSISVYQTRLAELLDARGDGAALEMYRVALSQDGENLAAARGFSRIAETRLDVALLTEAAENEQLLLRDSREGARLLVLAGGRLAEAGDGAGAAAKLALALEKDPNSADAAVGLTELYGPGHAEANGFLVDAIARAASAASSPQARGEMWLKVAHLHAERTKDNGAAIAAALRVVRESPDDLAARQFLAELYEQGGAFKECTAQWQEILQRGPDDALKLSALLRLAVIQTDRLSKPAPAEGHVKAALALDPDNREALAVLLRIQLAREEVPQAAKTAERLAEVATTPEERAMALHQAARLEVHRGNGEQAQQSYVSAVGILGAGGAAEADFRAFLESQGKRADWRGYCEALLRYSEQAGHTTDDNKQALAAIGRAMIAHLGDARGGVDYLIAALRLAPADAELRAEIARNFEGAGRLDDALSAYLELVRQEPMAPAHWRDLARCYERLVRSDEVRLALAPLVAQGEATAAEAAKYEASRVGPSIAASALDEAALSGVEMVAPGSASVDELLRVAQPALAKLYPVDLEALGISRADRLGSQSNHGLRFLTARIAAALGLAEFELYVHQRDDMPDVQVGLAETPTVIVSEALCARSEEEQVFRLGASLFSIQQGRAPLEALGPQALSEVLLACGRRFSADFASGAASGERADELWRRLSKAMPWFSGAKLEAASRAIAAEGVDIPTWVHSARVSSYRVGALLCDDLALAVRVLKEGAVSQALINDVVLFSFDDKAATLRRLLRAQ